MSERPSDRLLHLIVVLLAFAAAFHSLINADYWFHLRGGAEVAGGRIPRVDSFSYPSAGRPYIDLHWLFQLGLHALHGLGGVGLVLWMKAVLVAATFDRLYRLAREEAAPRIAAAATVGAIVLASERFLARPEVVSFAFFALLLALLRRDARSPGRALWLVPPLLAVWTNTEGLFVVGLGALGAHVLDRWRERRMWLVLFLSIAATLANPYGLEGALHPFVLFTRIDGSIDVYSSTIGEFLSPFRPPLSHPSVKLFPVYLAALGLGLLLSRRPRPSEIVMLAAFVFLGLQARRNLALLAIATLPLLARWWTLALAARPLSDLAARAAPGSRARAGGLLSTGVAVFALLYVAGLYTNRIYVAHETNRTFGAGIAELASPRAAVEFVESTDASAPLFSDLSSGSYLIWAWPERRVFIDGRLEVHATEHYARYLEMLSGGAAWSEAEAEFAFQTILLDHNAAPALAQRLVRDGAWSLCHLDGQALVLVRRSPENADYLVQHSLEPNEIDRFAPAMASDATIPPAPGLLARAFSRHTYPWSEVALGQFLFQIGAYDRAAEQYRRAVTRAPRFASPRILFAGALNQLGRPGEALAVLEAADAVSAKREDRARLHATLGDVLYAIGRYEEAVAQYDRWLARSPREASNVAGRVNRAAALLAAGRPGEARAELRRIVGEAPQLAEAYRWLGKAEETLGSRIEAAGAYGRYLELGGTDPEAKEALDRLGLTP